MKTLAIVAFIVAITVVFDVTASDANNAWTPYGSVRMATFWTSQDYGDLFKSNANPSGEDVFGRSGVQNLQWNLQSNSRIGATVKGDKLEARFELGVSSDGSGGNVSSRRLYGMWHFTEGWGLKVGKDYTPITFFLSSQVFDTDNGLEFVGNAYGARYGQIAVEGRGLKFAAITSSPTALDNLAGTVVDATTESKVPKFEASYQYNFTDAMSVHAFGGWQYYNLYWLEPVSAARQEEYVSSYTFGVGADLNFGPFYVKPQASYYSNGAVAGWLNTNLGLNSSLPQQTPFINATGNGIVDIKNFMAMLAVGFMPTDSLRLEAGIGYLGSKSEEDQGVDVKNIYLEYYLQTAVSLAPGVYIVPEIGYRDYGELVATGKADEDLGSLFYLGVKWEINF